VKTADFGGDSIYSDTKSQYQLEQNM